MRFKSLKKIKGFSIVIIPSGAGIETRSKHFSAGTIYSFFALYTVIIALLGFLLFNATPLKILVFPHGTSLSQSDKMIIDELNKRMLFLTNELETLKTKNQQLKDAIMLGDSAFFDTLSGRRNKINSLKSNPFGGNILEAVNELLKPASSGRSHKNSINFSMPLTGFISRGFDPDKGHMGIDIVAKVGSPIYAAASGYVVFSDFTTRDGYMLILAHSNGYLTVYKHCSALLKKARDTIVEGEIIALSGNSGEITTGPHLHFEIWKDGKPIDPKTVLINY